MKMKKYIITEQEYKAVKEAARKNKHKRVEKRLQVILLRYEGYKDIEISEKLGYSRKRISQMCAEFKAVGLETYGTHKYGGNNRSLSIDEENEILKGFEERAAKGEIVTVQTIKVAFDEKLGKDTGRVYIYMLLERHGWRKIMPRSKHPQKASDEAIEASKKLTLESEK